MTALLACAALAVTAAMLLWLAGARGLILALAIISLSGGMWLFDRASVEASTSVRSPKFRPPATRSLAPLRHAFTGRFTSGERWLGMADALAARGNRADAVNILVAAVKQHPRDYSLWIGLGSMLTEHGAGLNPGAKLAFERANALAPNYPAPRFFYGLAKARSGDRQGALADFRSILAGASATASWRPLVEDRISALETSQVAD